MSDSDGYLRAWTEMGAAYDEDRFADALAVADEMYERFETHRCYLDYVRTALLCRAGEEAEALDLMAGVVDRGGWWSSGAVADPDLAPLRGSAGFEAAAERMAEREQAALARARADRPELIVRAPDASPRFALVALHMLGISAAETAEHWVTIPDLGGLLVVPESTLRDGDGNPTWAEPALVDRDVHDAVNATVPAGLPLLLAGGSQGARHAIRLALGGAFPDCRGFLAIVGAVAPDELAGPTADVRGWLLAGEENVGTRDLQRRLHRELSGRGVESWYDEAHGTGHYYPDDFAARLPAAVEFLLG